MKHNIKKISKIVDELNTYFLKKGAKHLTIDVKEVHKSFQITFIVKIKHLDDESIERLKKCLNCDKSEEMEEYYWELTGESDTDTELSIIGMMTDDYRLTIGEEQLELIIYKNK